LVKRNARKQIQQLTNIAAIRERRHRSTEKKEVRTFGEKNSEENRRGGKEDFLNRPLLRYSLRLFSKLIKLKTAGQGAVKFGRLSSLIFGRSLLSLSTV
jgi:hypothetical protein